MDDARKHNNCINIPLSQCFRSEPSAWLHNNFHFSLRTSQSIEFPGLINSTIVYRARKLSISLENR
jgi:hypothetical protein